MSLENSSGSGKHSTCRTCRNERQRSTRRRMTKEGLGYSDASTFSRLRLTPLDASKADARYLALLREGNLSFLRAIWKSHAHVMLVHEANGRQVARP